MTFASKVLSFYHSLDYHGSLPEGIRIMNPYKEGFHATYLSEKFYSKYYDDENERTLILGINPGRFGAGSTGIPFTDTIRLKEKCGIQAETFHTYEPSSAFIYEMIEAFGGNGLFFSRFFISALCPLGFVRMKENNKVVNYNYYDNKELTHAVFNFIVDTLKQQLSFGINRKVAYCLGTGKNEKFLTELNQRFCFFERIISLEHPRFIMQYKSKHKSDYIQKYVQVLSGNTL